MKWFSSIAINGPGPVDIVSSNELVRGRILAK
jgi:hypothetical protein